jgi:prophage regulatory protein
MRILSKHQVKELVLYSPQHIARLEAAGKFPKRIRLGQNRVGWIEDEVREWLQIRIDARENLTDTPEQGAGGRWETIAPPNFERSLSFCSTSDSGPIADRRVWGCLMSKRTPFKCDHEARMPHRQSRYTSQLSGRSRRFRASRIDLFG